MTMLRGNLSHRERGVKPSQVQPSMVSKLRFFGMLAVLGPLFGGLNTLVIESVPQVEVRLVTADTLTPTPDVVVVEKVVERVVFVPTDNVSSIPASLATEQVTQTTGGTGRDSSISQPASTPESEVADAGPTPESAAAPSSAPIVAPAVRRVPLQPSVVAADEVADEEPAEAVDESAPDSGSPEVAEDVSEEPVATPAPRTIVVHTMTWDGEQFVESGQQVIIAGDGPSQTTEASGEPEQDAAADEREPESSADIQGDQDAVAATSDGVESVNVDDAVAEANSGGEQIEDDQATEAGDMTGAPDTAEDVPVTVATVDDASAQMAAAIADAARLVETDGGPEPVAEAAHDGDGAHAAAEATDEPEQEAELQTGEEEAVAEDDAGPHEMAETATPETVADQSAESTQPGDDTDAPSLVVEAEEAQEPVADGEGQPEQDDAVTRARRPSVDSGEPPASSD